MMICIYSRRRLNFLFVAKGEGYPELQLIVLTFAKILIDFYPKKAMESKHSIGNCKPNPHWSGLNEILHNIKFYY